MSERFRRKLCEPITEEGTPRRYEAVRRLSEALSTVGTTVFSLSFIGGWISRQFGQKGDACAIPGAVEIAKSCGQAAESGSGTGIALVGLFCGLVFFVVGTYIGVTLKHPKAKEQNHE